MQTTRKIFSYTVLRNKDIIKLTHEVNKMLEESWEPLGGMVVGNLEGTNNQFFQTMVIYTNMVRVELSPYSVNGVHPPLAEGWGGPG